MSVETDVEFRPGPVATDEVLFARQGSLGRIRLNRPRAINALTDAMVASMQAQLERWADDDTVTAVALEGAGERGLCAGGDVRALRSAILSGEDDPARFWAREYALDAAIARFPKHFVALMDGIVMGGGLGLSAWGSLRVATERSRVAMPETAIGFFPDVGMLYLLARAPGEVGTHLAMTGATVGGPDAVYAGLADVVLESRRLPDLVLELADGRVPEPRELDDDRVPVPTLGVERDWIDECYAGDDAAVILDRLRGHRSPAARDAAETIASRSPLSVAVTLEALRRAARLATPEQVFAQDLALGRAFLDGSDFVEGVRAVLVDRDHDPRWTHSCLADVPRDAVMRMFAGAPRP